MNWNQKIVLLFLLTVCTVGYTDEPLKDITLDYIYKSNEQGIQPVDPDFPRELKWSSVGHRLSFLVSDVTEPPHLVFYDPVKDATEFMISPKALHDAVVRLTSEPQGVPIALRSYPQRLPLEATNQARIDRYEWKEKEDTIRFHLGNKRYLWNLGENQLKEEAKPPALPDGEKNDVDYSPNKRYAAYTRANDLYVYDTQQKKEIRLTSDGSETLLNGRHSWVYWEEFYYRRRYRAFYWSPNNETLAYAQYDDSEITTYPITDFSTQEPQTKMIRFPKTGTRNPSVRLGVVSLSTRETRWIDLGEPYEYILYPTWTPDGNDIMVQALNREQNCLRLLQIDLRTGDRRTVLEETSDTWVEAMSEPIFLKDGSFLWLSERDGRRHLYHYSKEGKKRKPITRGEWDVNPSLWQVDVKVNEESGRIYFYASKDSPLEKQFYSAPLRGGEVKRLSSGGGMHSVEMSQDFRFGVDRYSNVNTPKRIQVINAKGRVVRVLGETQMEDYAPYWITGPEIVSFEDKEGNTFYGSLYKPRDFDPSKKYPVIVNVYGGPAGQTVSNQFDGPDSMIFVSRGFLYFGFDNRGTPGRGREWLEVVYKNFSEIPAIDFAKAAEYLRSLPYVKKDGIGIWGWSHGGYSTLNAMLKCPDAFQAGAAVAAPTDWRLYDTVYTEKYMGLPEDNEEGYQDSAPIHFAKQLKGKLLIAQGLSDDNVHPQNTFQMVQALTEANKEYELYVYPERDHGIGGDAQRYHLFDRILSFFEEHLGKAECNGSDEGQVTSDEHQTYLR